MDIDTFKILLVDDTPANLDLLVDYLTAANFEVFVAENGSSALERLRHVQPDLILLDLLMPGMSGFEVCKTLKANLQTRHIPVIFLTAREETADKVKGFAVGGIDYITKPLVEAEVLARVRTHLQLARTHRYLHEENYKLQRRLAYLARSERLGRARITPPAVEDVSMIRLTLFGAFQLTVKARRVLFFAPILCGRFWPIWCWRGKPRWIGHKWRNFSGPTIYRKRASIAYVWRSTICDSF